MQQIQTDFSDYETFFNLLYSPNCILPENSSKYIKWSCTPSKDFICEDIKGNLEILKSTLEENSNENITVKMLHFVQREETTKKGKTVNRLKAEAIDCNISWVLNFLETLLPSIINHRNLLKNYCTNIETLINSVEHVAEIGLDFSENITLPVNKEPQSLHWGGCKEQKTVHSGLSRTGGTKTFISDDLTHDQAFVKVAIEEILDKINIQPGQTIIISSDNCTSQYKSSQHFHDLQVIATKYNVRRIRIYGIAGHGKNEIDTVGGCC